MGKSILRCTKCHNYTLKETCPICNSSCITTKPSKFSPEDRFGKYRRAYKNDLDNKTD